MNEYVLISLSSLFIHSTDRQLQLSSFLPLNLLFQGHSDLPMEQSNGHISILHFLDTHVMPTIDQLFFHLQTFLSHHVLQVLFLAFASLHRFSILCPSLVVCSRVLLEAHIFSHNTLSGDLILSLD